MDIWKTLIKNWAWCHSFQGLWLVPVGLIYFMQNLEYDVMLNNHLETIICVLLFSVCCNCKQPRLRKHSFRMWDSSGYVCCFLSLLVYNTSFSFNYTTVVHFWPIRGLHFTVIWGISQLSQHGSICLAWMHTWHKLVNTFVFVDMKFNPRQASDKFHINKNAGVN